MVGFYDERAFLFYRRKKEISFEFTAAVVFKHDAQINEFCFADIFYCKKLVKDLLYNNVIVINIFIIIFI